jgi:hypothetical protein
MPAQSEENRLKNFAGFFKSYMGVMPLVTAAFAPVLTLAKAIPVFESQKTSLATFSGLFGFLLVAWVFSARSVFVPVMTNRFDPSGTAPLTSLTPLRRFVAWLGRYGFRTLASIAPLFLVGLSAFCYIDYLRKLDAVLDQLQANAATQHLPQLSRDQLLRNGTLFSLPGSTTLQILYIGIFVSAEFAFVAMALREYGYSTLGIKEQEIMSGAWAKSTPHPAPAESDNS